MLHPCARAPASTGGEFLHAFCTLVFISGALVFAVSSQETAFNHLSLVAEGSFIPGSHKIVAIIETFLGRLLFPRWHQWYRICLPMQVDIRDPASIPGSGRSPGGAHGNSLQNPCLENPMDRGSWWATVHGVAKSQTQLKRLRGCAHTHTHTPPRQFTDCGLRYSLQSF